MKRHPLDPVSLVFGALFAAIGLFLVISDARWEAASAAWVLPGLLVIVGTAILWSTLRQFRDGTDDGIELGELKFEEAEQEPVTDQLIEYPIPDASDL